MHLGPDESLQLAQLLEHSAHLVLALEVHFVRHNVDPQVHLLRVLVERPQL